MEVERSHFLTRLDVHAKEKDELRLSFGIMTSFGKSPATVIDTLDIRI